MKMTLRKVTPEDVGTVYKWWKAANIIMPPIDTWPETTFLASGDDIPMYAISLHLTNSPLAWLENFVANPEIPAETRKKLIKYGLEQLAGIAKESGAKYFWAYASNPKLAQYYEEMGFKVMQSQLVSMARKI